MSAACCNASLENRLEVKAEKCEFYFLSVTFLGCILAGGQVETEPVKIWAEWMAHSHVIEASPTVSCSQHLRPALSSTLHILVFPHQCSESTHLPCNYLDSGHSCDDSPSHLANSFQNSITHLLAPAWPPARRVTGNIRLEPHFPTRCISDTLIQLTSSEPQIIHLQVSH